MKNSQRRNLRQLKEQGISYEQEKDSNLIVLDRAQPPKTSLKLKQIKPLTDNQQRTFDYFDDRKNLMLHGLAGTGKTFISLYLALREILEGGSQFKKVYIIRSVVPTRDIGFLPGTTKEKVKVYEAPYYAICTELFGRSDAYEILKARGVIEFVTTSFIRGMTLNNGIIVVDECQNQNFHELDSVITRIGHQCKVLFCGDFRQSDLNAKERSGIVQFMKILEKMNSFEYVDFQEEDIVRSGLVKQYIIMKDRLGIETV